MGLFMMRSEWRYILAFLVIFLALPYLNYFVDPLHLHSEKDRFVASDRPVTPPEWARQVHLESLQAHASRIDKEVVIVGTSHVGVGIDSCDQDFAKIWLPGMGGYESIKLIKALAEPDSSNRLIILDMAALADRSAIGLIAEQGRSTPFWDSLFNPYVTYLTLRKISGAHHESFASSVSCHALPATTRDPEIIPAHLRLAFSQGYSGIERGITELAAACRNPNVKVAIVLFPFYFSQQTLAQASNFLGYLDGSKKIELPSTPGGCQLTMVNLAAEAFQARVAANTIGADTDHWFDFNHFRPDVGSVYLNTVLGRMGQ
jgi:hypothetical protein